MCAIKVVDNHAQPLEIALRLSNMLAEVLVVAATWRATFELARQTGNIIYFHWHTSLTTLLLRDGTHALLRIFRELKLSIITGSIYFV